MGVAKADVRDVTMKRTNSTTKRNEAKNNRTKNNTARNNITRDTAIKNNAISKVTPDMVCQIRSGADENHEKVHR